jgi:hypothetical protein
MIVNVELEWTWKEVVIAYFKNFPEETAKNLRISILWTKIQT